MTEFDTTFVIQMQLAIIGVIAVVGLFYIWRVVCRIEDRLQATFPPPVCEFSTQKPTPVDNRAPFENGSGGDVSAEDFADAMMSSVFGHTGDVFIMSTSTQERQPGSGSTVEVIDVTDDAQSPPDAESEAEAEAESEAETLSSGLSKTKLKKMSINLLKELCTQRGLSADGAKSTLIDRLLAA
jgi:hypothetical protein